ncbi:MAG: biopolymer transporter ExbD [Acidimicrobiia bacterium]|nr:biopolymer transporter ExbD [Acidimicrobiia bacterium]
MAFSFSSQGGGRRGRQMMPLSEMNVIPLVDVVLVLLIIFMLTAHVMEFGLEVEVPKVKQVRTSAEELPVVTVTREGELQLNDAAVNINALGDEVKRRFPGQQAVFVRADKGTTWDMVAQVFNELGEAKLSVQAVTQPEEETASGR